MNTAHCTRIVIAFVAVSFLALTSANAELKTWDGGGDGTKWTDPDNWNPNGVPVEDVDNVTIITNATINMDKPGDYRNVYYCTVILSGCTITNGIINFGNAVNGGALIATDVTFTNGGLIGFGPPRTTLLSNVVVRTSGWGVLIAYGAGMTYTVIGGDYDANNTHGVFGDYGTNRFTIDGGLDTHGIGKLRVNAPDAAFGVITPAYDAIFTMTNNASVRIGSSGGLEVGLVGTGRGIVNLDSGTLRVDGGIVFGSNAVLNVGTGGTQTIHYQGATAGISNYMTSAASFNGEGLTLKFWPEVSPSVYEVGGTDQGAVLQAFHDNYSLLNLKVGAFPGPMKLIDVANNDGQAGSEAFYVDEITEDGNFTFDLNGLNFYYKKLTVNSGTLTVNNGSLTQVTGATLIATSSYVHAPEGAKRFTKGDAPLAIGSDYGTTYVSGFPAGKPVLVDLTVSGTPGNIDALRAELGGRGSGTNIRMSYAGVADGNDLFFDWNFSHRSVTLDSLSAEVFFKGTIFTVF